MSQVSINDIIFQEIKGFSGYGVGKYADFEVVIMKENGYINAPKMLNMIAKLEGKTAKRINNWNENKTTIELKEELSSAAGIPEADLTVEVKSVGKNQEICGTYIHPDLVPALILWACPKFYIKVIIIINEWRKIKGNEERYHQFIKESMVPSGNQSEESKIRDRLAKELDGEKEVKCDFGIVDILTDEHIIEVKTFRKYKHAVGQLLFYKEDYPERKMRLHLFNVPAEEAIIPIRNVCEKYNIELTYEQIITSEDDDYI